jgi:hypothetical protein
LNLKKKPLRLALNFFNGKIKTPDRGFFNKSKSKQMGAEIFLNHQ